MGLKDNETVTQPLVNPSPSPNRTAIGAISGKPLNNNTPSYGSNHQTDDEQPTVIVSGSLNTQTPQRPNNNNNNKQDQTQQQQIETGLYDSTGRASRQSHDSSMNYHRMEGGAAQEGDRIPLRESDGRGSFTGGDDRLDGKTSNTASGYNGIDGGKDGDNLYGDDGSLIPSPAKDSEETDPNSPGEDIPEAPLEHHYRTNVLYKRAIFSTLPVFMAYASMITLQRSIKDRLNITNNEKEKTDLFGVAVGNLYLGNLIFRLLHNVLFSFMKPRQRVMLSYTLLSLNHLIIGLAYWVFDSQSLVWTFIAYLLAGIGIGTFESNLLSCLSPFGHGTKSWAVIGIPIGFNGVSVGFYILFAIEPHLEWLKGFPYFLIAVCNLFGLGFFIWGLPYIEYSASNDNVKKFKEDLCRYSEWFPRVRNYCFALCADMFCVSMFSAIVYYIYNVENIPLWPYAEHTIPKNVFQVWYNFCSFIGDFSGRKIAYADKHKRNPYMFLIFSLVGIFCVLSKVVILAPFGMMFIMFANGSIYAHATKHIDNVVDDRFILIALSVWLFVGDIGSYVASLIVQPLQIAIGSVPERWEPDNSLPNWWPNMTNLTAGGVY